MITTKRTLQSLLLPALSLALLLGCDKKADDKQADDDKADAKKADDKKADDTKAEEPEPEPEAPKGPVFTGKGVMGDEVSLPLVAFDLAAVELPGFTIQVPEGTKAEDASGGGKKLLNTKVNYSIAVREGAFDKEGAKKTFAAVDPEGKIADESETHLIYQRSGEGGFLFSAGATVGDKQFKCNTVASISAFDRQLIDQAVESCKSIAAAAAAGDAAPAEGDAAAPQ